MGNLVSVLIPSPLGPRHSGHHTASDSQTKARPRQIKTSCLKRISHYETGERRKSIQLGRPEIVLDAGTGFEQGGVFFGGGWYKSHCANHPEGKLIFAMAGRCSYSIGACGN